MESQGSPTNPVHCELECMELSCYGLPPRHMVCSDTLQHLTCCFMQVWTRAWQHGQQVPEAQLTKAA
jgi:hypothetical protein